MIDMMLVNVRKLNMDTVLKIVVMTGFACFFLLTMQNGTVQLYVHPRIIPYMKFGAAAFILISLVLLKELFKPRKRKIRLSRYSVFLIPLLLFLAVPPKTADTGSISLGGMNKSRSSIKSSQDLNSEAGIQENLPSEEGAVNSPAGIPYRDVPQLKLENGIIVMNDQNYVQWLQELYENLEKYDGKRIEVIGFVLKDKEFNENQFVPARLIMACCAADAQPIGLLCTYGKSSELKKDAWVKVSGTISRGEFKNEVMPVIIADVVEKAEKPKIDYLYPY